MTRAITEPAVVVDEMFDDGAPLPPAPSRPADEPRFMGMTPDTWAVMVERKLDAYDTAHRQRHEAQALNFAAFKSEVLEVLEVLGRVVEVLKTQERHERAIEGHRRDINEQSQAHMRLTDRVTPLERQVADVVARVKKLETAAAKRPKRE